MDTAYHVPRTALALAMASALWLSCEEPNAPQPPPHKPRRVETISLDKTEWIASAINGRPLVEGTNITVNFAADGLGGYDGCNWFGARTTVEGAKMTVGMIESTARGCLRPGVEEQASALHTALRSVASYRAQPAKLELLDAESVAVVTLAARQRSAMNPADLVGTKWASAENPEVTLQFGEGTTSGFAGCRDYTGTYTARDDHIRFTSLSMKEMECDRGLKVQRKEEELTTHLSEATHYRLHDGKLTIFTDPGHTLEFVRAAH